MRTGRARSPPPSRGTRFSHRLTSEWPADHPVPQLNIEFDVGAATAVGPAAQELEQAGYELLHPPREEPWGQTVARLQSPEGAIVGISYIPLFHDQTDAPGR
ncbi:MAG TPA: VOC family protein [Mycobacterium sp.]|nr:VOC family protein [Mycobacterium sp.]